MAYLAILLPLPPRDGLMVNPRLTRIVLLSVTVVCSTSAIVTGSDDGAIEFSRDIRPILSRHCYHCHGADEAARQTSLRLDVRESALARLESGASAIVPGAHRESELFRRIVSTDSAERMPPEEEGGRLWPAP